MELGDLAGLIKGRRSIRAWQNKEVPEELLVKALDLAIWAPNGGNRQNWHFYLIKNRNTIDAVADAVKSTADIMAAWPESGQLEDAARMLERSSLFRRAPAIIVVTTAQYQSALDEVLALRGEEDAQAKQIRQWRNSVDTRIQSASSAMAYLLLVLHQMGLGAVWMTGPMLAKGKIEKVLQVPQGMDAIAIIPVGYPAESPEPRNRKPVAEVCDVIR